MVEEQAGALLPVKGNGFSLGGTDLPKQGDLQRRLGYERQLLGGGVVVLVIQTVGIDEMGVRQPQPGGPLVHGLGKGLDAARDRQGNGRRRVVGGLQKEGVEQLLQRQHLPRHQIDGGALDAHRLGGNGHRGFGIHGLQGHQGRHDLGGGGHGQAGVFILTEGDLSRGGLHEHRPSGGYPRQSHG